MKAARATVVLRIWELPLVEDDIIESILSLRNNLLTVIRSAAAESGFLLIATPPLPTVPLVGHCGFG